MGSLADRIGTSQTRYAVDLAVGDTFTHDGVTVTVLKDSEPCSDRFGQDLFRYWCRREDSGCEGWCTFGHGGVVQP